MSSVTKDLNLFQIIVLGVFLFIGVVGVVFFATNKAGTGSDSYEAAVWGVVPKSTIDEALATYRERSIYPKFTYTEIPEEEFIQTLLYAVAEGRGPDAIIFPNSFYYIQSAKLVTIPAESFSAKDFIDTYIDAGQQFMVADGFKAYPLAVDPLVMYWNRDMFAAEGLLAPPSSWSELAKLTNKLARKQDNGVIERAFVALGEYSNINHAKKIIFTLLSQVGVNISTYDTTLASYASGLTRGAENTGERTRSVLTYYTEFANPLKSSYTWNRSFSSSREAFLAGNLSIYFGPGSEVEYLRSRNPNLNFAVSVMPQENPNIKSVHGKTYALGFLVTSKNVNASMAEVVPYLTTTELSTSLAVALGMAPARRDALMTSKLAKTDGSTGAIYESAVYAKDWLDPAPMTTDGIFKNMIESITSGKQTLYEAVQDASDRLDALF